MIGLFLIFSTLKTDFSNPGETFYFVGAAVDWFKQLGDSTYEVGKTATEQDWLPKIDNETVYIVD